MKVKILESKIDGLIDNFLTDNYGNLFRFNGDEERNDFIFLLTEDSNKPSKYNCVFFFNIKTGIVYTNWEVVNQVGIFTGDEELSKLKVMKWLLKTYYIRPTKLLPIN